MANKHYAFWPFTSTVWETIAGDIVGAGKDLRSFRRPPAEGSTKLVRYGSKKHRGGLSGCNASNKSLYILGHGSAGLQVICNTPSGNDEVLHALQVVMRLREYGLQTTSECKVKAFSCYSGSEAEGSSFAKALYFGLRLLGYSKVSVFGYTAEVTSYNGTDSTYFRGTVPGTALTGLWRHASQKRIQITDADFN